MKTHLISPKIGDRHLACNILLNLLFTPFVLVDIGLIGVIVYELVHNSHEFLGKFLLILYFFYPLIGAYLFLWLNQWNGFVMSYSCLLTLSFLAGREDMLSARTFSPILFALIVLVIVVMIMSIRKNGVAAFQLLERGRNSVLFWIEIIFAILQLCFGICIWFTSYDNYIP